MKRITGGRFLISMILITHLFVFLFVPISHASGSAIETEISSWVDFIKENLPNNSIYIKSCTWGDVSYSAYSGESEAVLTVFLATGSSSFDFTVSFVPNGTQDGLDYVRVVAPIDSEAMENTIYLSTILGFCKTGLSNLKNIDFDQACADFTELIYEYKDDQHYLYELYVGDDDNTGVYMVYVVGKPKPEDTIQVIYVVS